MWWRYRLKNQFLSNPRWAVALFLCFLLSFESARAEDLGGPVQVVTTVLGRHPAVKKADELVRATEFGVKASRLQPNPTLTVAATAGDAGESSNALTQNFEISGQPHLRWRVATAKLESAKQQRRSVRRRVAAQAYRAWLSLWKADRLDELARLRMSLMQETKRVAYRRFEVGEIAQNEALRVELAAAQAEADAARAKAALESAQRTLEFLVGSKLEEVSLGADDPNSLLLSDSLTLERLLLAVEGHPGLQAQKHQKDALEYGAALTSKQRAPTLGLSVYRSHILRTSGIEQGAQLSLSWPILDWGRISNRKKQQEATAAAFAAGIEETTLARTQEVSGFWAQLQAAKTNRRILSDQASRYEELAREARLAYDLGMLSLTDVFQTEASFRRASVQLVEAKAEVLDLEVRLLERTGLPWPTEFLKEDS